MAFATIDYDGSGTSDTNDTSSTDQQTWADETPDSTTSGTSSTSSSYTFKDPDEQLRDAAFGEDSDTADDLGGSAILAAGGATTAAGSTISGTDTEIDPAASKHITEAAEGAVEGDDPDMDPQEAFEKANAALQEQVPASTIEVAGMEFHPLLLIALLGAGGVAVHYGVGN